MSAASNPLIEGAIKAIVKKAGSAVGRLADPQNGSWAVYELGRTSLSFIVGPESLHSHSSYHTEEEYNRALDLLTHTIDETLSRK